ncbi:MAG: DMT family transporter [Ilumatobacteraceae bacterium]
MTVSSSAPVQATPPATRRQAYLLLTAAICIGSCSFTFVRVALRELSPLTLATGRVVASATMFIVIVLRSPWRRRPVPKADRWKVFACGFGGSAVFHIFFNWGQQYVSVAIAAVIMATYPVMTALGEVVFLRHRLRSLQVMGLVLAVAGCAAIAAGGGLRGGSKPVIGAILVALATLVWAVVTIITRGFGDRYDSWWLNTPGTVFGALFMLAIDIPGLHEFADLSAKGWLVVIWLGTASSAFIYYSMARAMTSVTATTATSLSTIVTPGSVLVAWVFLGDAPSLIEVIGGAIVIVGVMLVVRNAVEPAAGEFQPAFAD